MLQTLALIIVVSSAIFLIALALSAFFTPALAKRFLTGFARSATVHVSEMMIRLLVGWSFVFYSPHMRYEDKFALFGWVLVVTSIVLLCVPWRWHYRFAEVATKPLIERVWLFGLLALPLGGVILFATLPNTNL